MALFLLFLLPLTLAYQYHDYVRESDYKGPEPVNDTILDNCMGLSIPPAICGMNETGNFTEIQKKILILAAMNPDASEPDFSFLGSWNEAIHFSKYPPFGSFVLSSGSIRDAWVEIVWLQPSVLLDNRTLLNQTGSIQTELGFTFVLPDQTAPGDCKTVYSAKGYNYSLTTTLNGTVINADNGKTALFSLTNASNMFESNLSIESGYLARHYVWVTHCSKTSCWQTCDYAGEENVTDNLNLSDSKTAFLYNFTFNTTYLVDRNFSGIMDYRLSYNVTDDFSEIRFSSGNSFIRVRGVRYHLRYDFEPYNVLSYEAVRTNETTSYLASILDDNQTLNFSIISRRIRAILPYSDSCTITFRSHFNISRIPKFCNITNETPVLNLTLISRTNGSITFGILFFDNSTSHPIPYKDIRVSYGGLESNMTTDALGKSKAVFPYQKENHLVTASFSGDFSVKSAESFLVIPEPFPELDDRVFYTIILLLVLFLLLKTAKRLMPNA
jgi:hypothetical protein